MKINLKKLKEIEETYCSLRNRSQNISLPSELTSTTLQHMVKIVLEYNVGKYACGPENVKIAFNTLKSIGIIEETKEDTLSNVQQLNS